MEPFFIIVTIANLLDSATARGNANKKIWPPDNKKIIFTKDFFKLFGFESIHLEAIINSSTSIRELEITIKTISGETWSINKSTLSKFNKGNATKNTMLAVELLNYKSYADVENNHKEDLKNYITALVIKQLGDKLQVILLLIYKYCNPVTTAMATGDLHGVALLCYLLELPCIYSGSGAGDISKLPGVTSKNAAHLTYGIDKFLPSKTDPIPQLEKIIQEEYEIIKNKLIFDISLVDALNIGEFLYYTKPSAPFYDCRGGLVTSNFKHTIRSFLNDILNQLELFRSDIINPIITVAKTISLENRLSKARYIKELIRSMRERFYSKTFLTGIQKTWDKQPAGPFTVNKNQIVQLLSYNVSDITKIFKIKQINLTGRYVNVTLRMLLENDISNTMIIGESCLLSTQANILEMIASYSGPARDQAIQNELEKTSMVMGGTNPKRQKVANIKVDDVSWDKDDMSWDKYVPEGHEGPDTPSSLASQYPQQQWSQQQQQASPLTLSDMKPPSKLEYTPSKNKIYEMSKFFEGPINGITEDGTQINFFEKFKQDLILFFKEIETKYTNAFPDDLGPGIESIERAVVNHLVIPSKSQLSLQQLVYKFYINLAENIPEQPVLDYSRTKIMAHPNSKHDITLIENLEILIQEATREEEEREAARERHADAKDAVGVKKGKNKRSISGTGGTLLKKIKKTIKKKKLFKKVKKTKKKVKKYKKNTKYQKVKTKKKKLKKCKKTRKIKNL